MQTSVLASGPGAAGDSGSDRPSHGTCDSDATVLRGLPLRRLNLDFISCPLFFFVPSVTLDKGNIKLWPLVRKVSFRK